MKFWQRFFSLTFLYSLVMATNVLYYEERIIMIGSDVMIKLNQQGHSLMVSMYSQSSKTVILSFGDESLK
jgi:hypothetical protein